MATTTTRAAIGPTHPLYDQWAPIWALLADCADGTGGFQDGTYLIPHPREWDDHKEAVPRVPSKKLKERRALARYERLASVILTLKLGGLFREPATRRVLRQDGSSVEEHPYLTWCQGDVDGAGHPLDAFLATTYRAALVFGWQWLLMDRTHDDAGTTAAERAPLLLRAYRPLDVPDWIDRSGALKAVKIVESVPRVSLDDAPTSDRVRIYAITDSLTRITEQDSREALGTRTIAHGFGALPIVPLYAHRPDLTAVLGQSALSDPKLYVDLYNLTSEVRELLRKQTFSLLNIPLGAAADGTGPSVSIEQAQAMIGQTTGTANVLYSALPAQYISADTSNVVVYQAERTHLIQTIFRLCAVPFDTDTREAETAEARRLKRQDYTTTLAGYADRLREAELAIAQLWYRGTYGEAWQREWDAATPTVSYPQAFDEPTFAEVLEQAQAALALPLGDSPTFRVEHSSRLVAQFLPDASNEVQAQIRAELEAQPSPAEERAARLEALADGFRRAPADDTPDGPADDEAA